MPADPTSTSASPAFSDLLAELVQLVERITARIGGPLSLTGKDRIRSTKLRKGGAKVIPDVAAVADQVGLDIAGHPTSRMLAQLALAQELIPLRLELVTALKRVDDAIFVSHSKSFSSASIYYATLRRLGKGNGEIASSIESSRAFFARRPRAGAKKPAADAPATSTKASPAGTKDGA